MTGSYSMMQQQPRPLPLMLFCYSLGQAVLRMTQLLCVHGSAQMLPLHACIEQREYEKTHQMNAGDQHQLSGVNNSKGGTDRYKHVSVCFQVGSQIPLKYAVLPASMCDDQPELCPCNVPWQGHELLGRSELVEVWPCQIVRSLCWRKGFLYQVLGNTLQSNSKLISR